MDPDGYPDDEELRTIREWPVPASLKPGAWDDLVDYIRRRWKYADAGYFKLHGLKDGWALEMHTAGWSGNESIIEALMHNLFWSLYWQRSGRGGHYYFEIPGGTDEQ